MPEVPECLNRRYVALDELIQELNALDQQSQDECFSDKCKEPGIRLMCDFWNILKEDPDCDLSQAVKQRMILPATSSSFQQNLTCYMAGKCCSGSSSNQGNKRREEINKRTTNVCGSPRSSHHSVYCPNHPSHSLPKTRSRQNILPLTKVLCNLQEAASFDKKCCDRVEELMKNQNELIKQIQHLEQREKEGVQLLNDADCLWACMENAYKKKIKISSERQHELLFQLKEIEKSTTKWRKNKKDLEFKMDNLEKYHQEITERITQKKNDTKCVDIEIENYKKKIVSNKDVTDGFKKIELDKKEASDSKINGIAAQITKLKSVREEVQKQKETKEKEGQKYVKEAREDLQKICRVLLQKKLEKEDLLAEKEGIECEINLLKQSCDLCKEKCKNKQDSITEEIKKIDQYITENRDKCVQCHQCVDTGDARRLCNDCPRCKEKRECKTEGDHCDKDPDMDCVCVSVKEKFLNNIFDNMYAVLEGRVNTPSGKHVADAVLKNLQISKNGKLSPETRQLIHEFVLNTVKKNLNLTIVGGAVKTRCEMDKETYQQLMLCLKRVKVEKPPKEDKGTDVKKPPCRRWGGTSECNCPGDVKSCPCTKRAPPPPSQHGRSKPASENVNVNKPDIVACPKLESTVCGPDCDLHPTLSAVDTDASSPKPVCNIPSCTFSKNMRAAQCVLGPESLDYNISEALDSVSCECGKHSTKSCSSKKGHSTRPREKIIEEVMGRNIEVTPIQKVMSNGEHRNETKMGRNTTCKCVCDKYSNTFEDRIFLLSDESSDILLIEGTEALEKMLSKNKLTHVYKPIMDRYDGSGFVKTVNDKKEVKILHFRQQPKIHVNKPNRRKTEKLRANGRQNRTPLKKRS